MDKPKHDEAPIKVYRIDASSLLPYLLIIVIIGVTFPIIKLTWDSHATLLLVLLILMDIYELWVLLIVARTKLSIYRDGLELQRGNQVRFAVWENMSHFGIKSHGKGIQTGIYLHEAIEDNKLDFLVTPSFSSNTDFLPIGQVKYLPFYYESRFKVAIDTNKLAETEFGQQLLHYAPHLFEYGEEKVKNG